MTRIRLSMPESYLFSITLPVRITDINYGNHLGNEKYLGYMHEARVAFFANYGCTEMNLFGVSVIMGDAVLVYKREAFYGMHLTIDIAIGEWGRKSFDLLYRFTDQATGQLICEAKTAMVCYDYTERKPVFVPEAFRQAVIHNQVT